MTDLRINTDSAMVEIELPETTTTTIPTPKQSFNNALPTPNLLKSGKTKSPSKFAKPIPLLKKRLTTSVEALSSYNRPELASPKSPSIVGHRLWGVSESTLNEIGNDDDEARSAGYCFKQTIHPESVFRIKWNFLSLLVVLYCCIDIPIDIAFYPNIEVNFGFVINCIFDVFFVVDIFLNFQTGYDLHGTVIMDRKKASNHYLRNGFAIDAIASLPIDYFSFLNKSDSSSITKASKLIRVLRIFRLLRLFRLPRLFRYSRRFTDKINSGYLRVLKLVFLLLLFAHWNACVLFLIASLNTSGQSWITQLEEEVGDLSVNEQYSWSLFMGLSHMLCIGYGVFPPSNTSEAWATILSMSIGASLFACIVGSITAVLLSLDSAGDNFQHYMNEANAYFDHRQVPLELRAKIKIYLSMRWSQRHGERMQFIDEGDEFIKSSGIKMYDEEKILGSLSPYLKRELSLTAVKFMLNKNPVFADSFFPVNVSHHLAQKLKETLFMHGNTLVWENEPPERLYFIRKGKVDVSKFGTRFGTHSEGSYIGELPFLFPETIKFQPTAIMASSLAVEAYELSSADFQSITTSFPDVLTIMRLVAEQRLQKLHLQKYIPTSSTDKAYVEDNLRLENLQQERVAQLEELFKSRASAKFTEKDVPETDTDTDADKDKLATRLRGNTSAAILEEEAI